MIIINDHDENEEVEERKATEEKWRSNWLG